MIIDLRKLCKINTLVNILSLTFIRNELYVSIYVFSYWALSIHKVINTYTVFDKYAEANKLHNTKTFMRSIKLFARD